MNTSRYLEAHTLPPFFGYLLFYKYQILTNEPGTRKKGEGMSLQVVSRPLKSPEHWSPGLNLRESGFASPPRVAGAPPIAPAVRYQTPRD